MAALFVLTLVMSTSLVQSVFLRHAGSCTSGSRPEDVPIVPGLRDDKDVVTDPSNITYRVSLLGGDQKKRLQRGVWEADTETFIRAAFASDPSCQDAIFIDGGAAFGYYSLLAAKTNPCREVHAFNPHPTFAYEMRLNLADNIEKGRLTNPNICIERTALSGKTGFTRFSFGYGGGMNKQDDKDSVQVPMDTLDNFFEKHIRKNVKVLLVKLDVEGQELEVITGATTLMKGCRVKNWIIGIHNADFVEPITSTLKANGYSIKSSSAEVKGQPNGEVFASCER